MYKVNVNFKVCVKYIQEFYLSVENIYDGEYYGCVCIVYGVLNYRYIMYVYLEEEQQKLEGIIVIQIVGFLIRQNELN